MAKSDSAHPHNALIKKLFVMNPLAAAIISALPASVAMAQDQDQNQDANDFAIEEVIVTATKRAVSIQDVAQSITAFSTTQIERIGIQDMADIAANLPSVSLASYRAGMNELVYRGIGADTSWRLDSQVAVYLDDMPMTASTTQLDARMVDIERVESLPGPQGTLFGSSSQTGALRIVTNKPRFDGFSGSVSAEIASTKGGEESYDINGFLNIPITDNFAIRLVGYTNKDGGYIDNVYSTAPHSVCAEPAIRNYDDHDYYCADLDFEQYGVEDQQGHLNSAQPDNAGLEQKNFNDYEMTGGRISALWNINENWSALGMLMTQSSETTGVWSSDTAIGDFKVARFADEWRKDKWSVGTFSIKGDLGFAELSNSFGYAEREQTYNFQNVHYEAYHTRMKGQYFSAWQNWYDTYWYYPVYQYNYYDKYDTGYNGGVYRSLQDADRITNELRLTSTSDSRFQWMIGAFYEDNNDGWEDHGDIPNLNTTKHWDYTQWRSCDLADQGYEGVQCPMPDPNNTWYIDIYDREIKQIALFGELNYNLTEKLRVTGGARWFQYDRYVVSDRQWPRGFPVEDILLDGETVFIEEGDESDTVFKLAVDYQIDEDKMVYALFSQGFRLGGANNAKSVRVGFVEEFYDPDRLNNYEIGMKTEWLDNRLQINATLFYMKWEDMQLSITSDNVWYLDGTANGGGGENTGLELDFTWMATERLRINGGFYIGDAKYTEDFITLEGVLEVAAGTRMPDSPSEKFSIAVDYTIPNLWGGDMWFRYDGYYVGPRHSALWRADEANPDSENYVEGATYDVDSFTMSNFQVGYAWGEGWSTRLMIRNLFDARANTYTGGGASWYAEYWGHTGFGETNNLARPRTISLKFTKDW
jgi:iron complex outermembrane receptor protein